VLAKPPVRKFARDLGVDLALLTGSGPSGIVTREDVQTAAQTPAPSSTQTPSEVDREHRVIVKGVRKHTADAMVASAFTAPHVTCFLDVDMTATMETIVLLRTQPEFADTRIGPLVMAAKAVLTIIPRYPMINSSWQPGKGTEPDQIVLKRYVNLGIAAATDRGLLVPNIKDAQLLSTPDLARAISRLVEIARAGKTPPSDMQGGTFTITNIGVFGVDAGTPIIPPGEAAILGVGAVTQRAWVVDGVVSPRSVCTLSLSFDHRIIDGEQGSKFLAEVGNFLHNPAVALLSL
jgi:2-oxoisovalerate dehydrogenase E2 component (dihydrolipoyl transacylase)